MYCLGQYVYGQTLWLLGLIESIGIAIGFHIDRNYALNRFHWERVVSNCRNLSNKHLYQYKNKSIFMKMYTFVFDS